MQIVFLIGRVLFSLFWLKSAYNHFKNSAALAGYAASKGVPAARLGVIVSGLLLLVGGLSMLTGLWPWVGLTALAIFLVFVTPSMHAYWKDADPMARMGNEINFWKNLTLLGAILMMYMISMPWPYSV